MICDRCIHKKICKIEYDIHNCADFFELVRCKDCKYCDRHHLVDGLFCYRLYEKYNKEYPQMIIEVDADDFCSKGERK